MLDAFPEAQRETIVSGPQQKRVLVVAVGNPDRGDDAAGALVAEKLEGRLPPGVTLVRCSGDLINLIEEWRDCDALICVDAAAATGVPGRVHRIDGSGGVLPHDLSFPSSHAFGLAEALALARMLGLIPPIVVVYAIEGAAFDFAATIAPEVAAACREVADMVVAEIGQWGRGR